MFDLHQHCTNASATSNFYISEGLPKGSFVGNLSQVAFSQVVEIVPSSDLNVDISTKIITTKVILDRETVTNYHITLFDLSSFKTHTVYVNVTDLNDNTPRFSQAVYDWKFDEGLPVQQNLKADDGDFGSNSTVGYSILSGNIGDMFMLIEFTDRKGALCAELVLAPGKALDRETRDAYLMNISATDGGNPARVSFTLVNITVGDVNDHKPVFLNTSYSANTLENSAIQTSILRVFATDNDIGTNGDVEYIIERGSHSDPDYTFSIFRKTGVIVNNVVLDYEDKKDYNIYVKAENPGSGMFSRAPVAIYVLDENDNPPDIRIQFERGGRYQVIEDALVGTVVARVYVSDRDSGKNGEVDVTLEGGNGHFSVQSDPANNVDVIAVAKHLDRETQSTFTLRVVAKDRGQPQQTSRDSFILNVGDINDNRPVFDQSIFNAVLSENATIGTHVVIAHASDRDLGTNAQLVYNISYSPQADLYKTWFQINSSTGEIRTAAFLDREKVQQPVLNVTVTDSGTPPLKANCTVFVNLSDTNDNNPVFSKDAYFALIAENVANGTIVVQVSATDIDSGMNGKVHYSLEKGQSQIPFVVDSNTGVVSTAGPIDHEHLSSYLLKVMAIDGGWRETSSNLNISVQDVNDNYPVINPSIYNVSVYENLTVGDAVTTILAKDNDSGLFSRLTFYISSGNIDGIFHVNPSTGLVTLLKELDRETKDFHQFEVNARDGGGLKSKNTAFVRVTVLDINDDPPVFQPASYNFTIVENSPVHSILGSVYASSKDLGTNADIYYSIRSGDVHGIFAINSTGTILSQKNVDHEKASLLVLNVQAKDGGNPPLYGFANVTVTVVDLNDNSPSFASNEIVVDILEDTKVGQVFYNVTASDPDGGLFGQVHYTLLSNPNDTFHLDQYTGALSLTVPIDFEGRTRHYTIVVLAKDGGSPALNDTATFRFTVVDVNDHAPKFTNATYVVHVNEMMQVVAGGTDILKVEATDADSGSNARISYTFQPGVDTALFGLRPSGWIYIRQMLDREQQEVYQLGVTATDQGNPPKSSSANVLVNVDDSNDNDPKFIQKQYIFLVSENQGNRTYVGQVSATDSDAGVNAKIVYSFVSASSPFVVDSDTGVIRTDKVLDREVKSSYDLMVEARDQGAVPRKDKTTVTVAVRDLNDNSPTFRNRSYSKAVREDVQIGSLVIRVVADDPDSGENGKISYNLTGGHMIGKTAMFTVDSQTGEITTATTLDREQRDRYVLFVVAEDHGSPPKDNIVIVTVDVLDVNDNPPRFVNNSFFVDVPEKLPVGTVVTIVTASDIDAGNNGQVRYTIDQGNGGGYFAINDTSGVINLVKQLDYERKRKYQLRVVASDQGQNRQSSYLFVTVYVLDSNDNTPIFDKNPVTVALREGVPINFNVTTITAHDYDSGQNSWIRYSIDSQPQPPKFKVNPTTGVLQTIGAIDRESVDEYTLNVRATDQAFSESERLSSTLTVFIIVLDTNDNKPDFVSPDRTFVLEDEPFGYPIITITAIDQDSGDNALIRYSIVQEDSNIFFLDPDSGLLKLHGALDYETKTKYLLNISATDSGSPRLTSYQSLTIDLVDVNDNAPQFNQSLFRGDVYENEPVGSPVMMISAHDPDSGSNGALSYNIPRGEVMPKFVIDADTGLISTNSTLDREEKDAYFLTVYASDKAFPFRVATCTVKITVLDRNDHAPVFNPSWLNLTVMENRAPFMFHVMTAQDPDIGQNGRLRYAITSGNEDKNLAIDELTGELSTTAELDRENIPRYDLLVTASDITPPFYNSSAHVTIFVGDVNDNRPTFLRASYDINIRELTPINTAIFNVTAVDSDQGLNGEVVYSLSNKTFSVFRIDSKTGVIYTQQQFDFSVTHEYTFNCYATDRGVISRQDSAEVKVSLIDENNHAPVFQKLPYSSQIQPSVVQGMLVLTVSASDSDSVAITQMTYQLVDSSLYFQLTSSGELRVKQGVTLIPNGIYVLNVLADDGGNLTGRGIAEITVGPITHNPPIFVNSTPANVSISENSPNGQEVTRVIATRSGSSSGIVYSIISGNDDNAFIINRQSGIVAIANKAVLDFERMRHYRLQIIASLETFSSRNAYLTLNVNLLDVNDNKPLFHPANISVQLAEDDALLSSGFSARTVSMVTATDRDSGSNKEISYEIVLGNVKNKFAINSQTGVISTNGQIDREERVFYDLVVKATDQGSPPLSSSSHVFVNVVDVNDNVPSFSGPYTVSVDEDVKVGYVVKRIAALDADEMPNLIYSFSNGRDTQTLFHIDRSIGVVTVLESLDFEQTRSYALKINVSDGTYQSQTTLTVNVIDVNDNAPEFLNSSYQATLSEETATGTFILQVSAEDKDSGTNGEITYAFPSVIQEFRIDADTGSIYTAQKIEVGPQESLFFVVVSATDRGVPPQQAFVSVKIQISRTPRFNLPSYEASIPEDTKPGTEVVRVGASGINGTRIGFFITNDHQSLFRIGRRTGIIAVNKLGLDYEKDKNYLLLVEARDDTTNKSVVVGVNITITDVNDNWPIFDPNDYSVEVSEDASIGKSLLRVTATDRDSGKNGQVVYSINTGNDKNSFSIDGITGEIVTVKKLDYENMKRHLLSVQAKDQGFPALTRFASVVIRVRDLNDNKPMFYILNPQNVAVEENAPVGKQFYQVLAVDLDSGKNKEVTYSITGGNGAKLFIIDRGTGWLSTNASFDYETQSFFSLEVAAVDSGIPPLTNKINITVFIKSVDESEPAFVKSDYSFDLPGNAEIGDVVGQVSATDADGGEDGVVRYSFDFSSVEVFGINATSGVIFVNKSLDEVRNNRKRRSVELNERDFGSRRARRNTNVKIVSLNIRADSGKPGSKVGHVRAEVGIDFACPGCPTPQSTAGGGDGISGSALTVIIAVASVALVILIVLLVLIVAMYKRKKKARGRPNSRAGFDGSFDPIAVYPSLNGNVNQMESSVDNVSTPRSISQERSPLNGPSDSPTRRTDSSDSPNSASSGRGSSEGVDFEVDNPAVLVKGDVGSLASENYLRTVVAPDSGIHQDSDQASQLTISDTSSVLRGEGLGIDKRLDKIDRMLARLGSQESLHVFGEEGGGEADGGVDVGNLLYAKLSEVDADDDESIIDGIRPFVDEGHDHPSYGGSLSSIVGSREELTGSYNWDHLLDWGPQFQPLADVFLEIGKMKDDSPPKRNMSLSLLSSREARNPPAGIVTTDMLSSVSSFPRSPISPPSTRYTSPAFSPNFTPAITPLVTRSPSVSPLDTGASTPAFTPAGTTPKSGSRPSSMHVLQLRRDLHDGSNSDLTHSPSISDNESNLEIDV